MYPVMIINKTVNSSAIQNNLSRALGVYTRPSTDGDRVDLQKSNSAGPQGLKRATVTEQEGSLRNSPT
jgi:hypothetical protein